MPLRQKLVKELLDTEKVHVDGLTTFVEQFMKPMRQQNMIAPNHLQQMVINIELVHSWHTQFYNNLKNRIKKDLDKPFGDLFNHMASISFSVQLANFDSLFFQKIPVLRQLYAQFNENYQKALELYRNTLETNRTFGSFVEKKRQETGKDFLHYLYMPIQRVIAYDSLLKDIVHNTDKKLPDYADLHRGLQSLRSLIKLANERAVQRKNSDKVLKIQEMLGDSVSNFYFGL